MLWRGGTNNESRHHLHKQVHDKKASQNHSIGIGLICVRWVYFQGKSHNHWKYAHPFFEESLESIANGHILETTVYYNSLQIECQVSCAQKRGYWLSDFSSLLPLFPFPPPYSPFPILPLSSLSLSFPPLPSPSPALSSLPTFPSFPPFFFYPLGHSIVHPHPQKHLTSGKNPCWAVFSL